MLQPVTLFLLLHAFSNGTTSLTGVEAISNGISAFKETEQSQCRHHADLDVGLFLGTFLLAISFLAVHIGAVPSEYETVISQIARTVYGDRNFMYICTIARSHHGNSCDGSQYRFC